MMEEHIEEKTLSKMLKVIVTGPTNNRKFELGAMKYLDFSVGIVLQY